MRRLWSRRGLLSTGPSLPALASLMALDMRSAAAARSADDPAVVDLRQFGARGDGRSDDTDAFQAMHAHLFALQTRTPQRHFVIWLAPGHYRYRWNRWIWGLRHVTVIGYGASIQCISDSMYSHDKHALVTNRNFFDRAGFHDEPGQRLTYGYEIATARPGDLRVRLKPPVQPRGDLVGRHVLVMSYDQQFQGYPPNCRYFEFAGVSAADGDHVQLDRPLQHLHSEAFPEIADPHSRGRARLVPIDRDDVPLAVEQRLFGLTTLPNPNRQGTAHHVAAIGVLDFVAQDCSFVSFIASCGDRFSLERTSVEDLEPDKLVNRLSLSDCRVTLITEATGVNMAHFRGCHFEEPVAVEARNVTFEGCSFRGALQPGAYRHGIDLKGFAPTRSLLITGCVFHGRAEPTGAAVSEAPMVGLRLAPPAALLDDGIIELPLSDPRTIRLLRTIEPRSLLLVDRSDGEGPGSDGRYGLLEDIMADGHTVRLRVRFSAPVEAGDVLWAPRLRRLLASGNVFLNLGDTPPWVPQLAWSQAVEPVGVYRWGLSSSGPADLRRIAPGAPTRISVTVVDPYAGPEPGAFLRLLSLWPSYGRLRQVVDCRVPGRREIGRHDLRGAQPGDQLSILPPDLFVWSMKIQFAPAPWANEATPLGQAGQQARCLIVLETDDPFSMATASFLS